MIFFFTQIGFVEVLPQRGTYVTKFSMDKILEARFIREALETAVVTYLVQADESTRLQAVTRCEAILDAQKDAAQQDDAMRFQQLDDEFHQALSQSTPFPRLAQLIEGEKAHMDRVRNLSLHVSGQYNRVLEQHAGIIAALKTGSADTSHVTYPGA